MEIKIGQKEGKLIINIINKFYTLIPDGCTIDHIDFLSEINKVANSTNDLSFEEEELLKSDYPMYFERKGCGVKFFHEENVGIKKT